MAFVHAAGLEDELVTSVTLTQADKGLQSSSAAAKKKNLSSDEWTPSSEDTGCLFFFLSRIAVLCTDTKLFEPEVTSCFLFLLLVLHSGISGGLSSTPIS